jgi:CPA2 family monovalent cation:H+ antiporter-2
MGAFIAGLIISDSEYNHQIILDILPLRDYFVSIFFISIGMLLNVHFLLNTGLICDGLTLAIIAIKAILAFLATWLMKNPVRISLIVGIRLAQVGEFSLLIADTALSLGIFPQDMHQSFLIVSILSMLIAPLLIKYSTPLATNLFSAFNLPSSEPEELDSETKEVMRKHVIIAGYGLGGKHLSRVLQEANIHFIVMDLDGERIKQALAENIKAHYGDSTHRDTLRRAGIKNAKMIVFYISDYASTWQGVKLARELNPNIYIMVRTRYASHVEDLKSAGANEVIPEEFETSIEIFSRVLKEYHIPNNIIEQQ